MSENVTFTEEQFAKLIEAISPKTGNHIAEYRPDDESVTRSLALSLLNSINNGYYPGARTEEFPKYRALVSAVTELAKEHI